MTLLLTLYSFLTITRSISRQFYFIYLCSLVVVVVAVVVVEVEGSHLGHSERSVHPATPSVQGPDSLLSAVPRVTHQATVSYTHIVSTVYREGKKTYQYKAK